MVNKQNLEIEEKNKIENLCFVKSKNQMGDLTIQTMTTTIDDHTNCLVTSVSANNFNFFVQ